MTHWLLRTVTLALVVLAPCAAPSLAQTFLPTVSASIHDAPVDGVGDSFNATPFEGLLRRVGTSQADRAIQEFNVSSIAGATLQSATLSGTVFVNNSFDNGVRAFAFALYAGDGVAALGDYSIAATLVGTGSYHPPFQSSFTYSFDVTSTLQTLLSGGATHVGLHVDPTTTPNFPNILDDASSRLDVTVAAGGAIATYCYGDGSGTACPCGNTSAVGANEGCLNSLGAGGRLIGSGVSSLAADTIVLAGSGMPNANALYFEGTTMLGGGLGLTFGDGLRCAGGTIVRLGTKLNAGGASSYPTLGDLSVSVRGLVAPGLTYTYQAWYRNAATFCSSSTFNLTNGVAITWTP